MTELVEQRPRGRARRSSAPRRTSTSRSSPRTRPARCGSSARRTRSGPATGSCSPSTTTTPSTGSASSRAPAARRRPTSRASRPSCASTRRLLPRYLTEVGGEHHNLFAYPAQSNFSGVQHPLDWIEQAHEHGWDVLLDAAAFVPTNRLDLSRWHPDFVALSFYKMFGWPTGVGACIARREALAKLERPWFSGGTIVAAFVQREWYQSAPGAAHFEDGTVNFLNLPAVEIGLRLLDRIGIDDDPRPRRGARPRGCSSRSPSLRHADGAPAATIYGPRDLDRRGATIAFNFLHPDGRVVDERYVDRVARRHNISLRTGCFCNPGAGEVAFTISRETLVGGEFGDGHDARRLRRRDRPALRRRGPRLARARLQRRRHRPLRRLRRASSSTSPTYPTTCRPRPAADTRASVRELVLDRDECPDRCVGPALGLRREWELDTAEALWCSEGCAVEGVQGLAAVEVADPADSGVVVAASRPDWCRSSADRDVLEDRPGAERGRRGRDTGVAGRGEDDWPLCQSVSSCGPSVHVDVAVAGGRRVPARASGAGRAIPGAGDPVDSQVCSSWNIMTAPRVILFGSPVFQSACSSWGYADISTRSVRREGRRLRRVRRASSGATLGLRRHPVEGQVAVLGEELLQAKERCGRDRESNALGRACVRPVCPRRQAQTGRRTVSSESNGMPLPEGWKTSVWLSTAVHCPVVEGARVGSFPPSARNRHRERQSDRR